MRERVGRRNPNEPRLGPKPRRLPLRIPPRLANQAGPQLGAGRKSRDIRERFTIADGVRGRRVRADALCLARRNRSPALRRRARRCAFSSTSARYVEIAALQNTMPRERRFSRAAAPDPDVRVVVRSTSAISSARRMRYGSFTAMAAARTRRQRTQPLGKHLGRMRARLTGEPLAHVRIVRRRRARCRRRARGCRTPFRRRRSRAFRAHVTSSIAAIASAT